MKYYKSGLIMLALLLAACHVRQVDSAGLDQESVTFKVLPGNRFQFIHYRLAGADFEHSEKTYCKGVYKRLPGNQYELTPDNFNPDSIVVLQDWEPRESAKDQLHILISTHVEDQNEKGFKVILHQGDKQWIFSHLRVDTLISFSGTIEGRVTVVLPAFYINAHPPAIYTRLTTVPFALQSGGQLTLELDISKKEFYYKNTGIFRLTDGGNYVILDGKRIKKSLN